MRVMSKMTDKAVIDYVQSEMPLKVRKAANAALDDLFSGPGGMTGRGMSYGKATGIVSKWWDANMRVSLIVDDGGNVSTEYEFKRWLRTITEERYEDALKESDGDEEYAEREAAHEEESAYETSIKYESSDVARLIFGSDGVDIIR
jgi:hypothetical protein